MPLPGNLAKRVFNVDNLCNLIKPRLDSDTDSWYKHQYTWMPVVLVADSRNSRPADSNVAT